MRDRWEQASPAARARGDLGNRRLHAQWVRFLERKKKDTIANTAIARELAGWCWSLATLEQYPPTVHLVDQSIDGSAWNDPCPNMSSRIALGSGDARS